MAEIRKDRLHIPYMSYGSWKTLQTEEGAGKPGRRPTEVNVRAGRCRGTGPHTTKGQTAVPFGKRFIEMEPVRVFFSRHSLKITKAGWCVSFVDAQSML